MTPGRRHLAALALGTLFLASPLVANAIACPHDPARGDVPQDARDNICGTWDYAASHGFNPGTPLNETHPWGEGYIRDFSGGYYGRGGIMERHGEGWAFIVGGPYWDALVRAGGAPKIGFPDGPHVFGGHLNQGPKANSYMTFTKGVVNSSAHGTFASYGGIRARWNAMGNVTGPVGLPIGDEADTARVPGRYQQFEGGNLIWNPATGLTWHVYGGILNKYSQLGYSNHPLGLPTADRQYNSFRDSEYQVFQGGVINQYGGNAYETHGAILAKWNALGGANGPVGLPISDEAATARAPGRFSRFQGGNIYYNQRLNATYHVYGGILNKYLRLGYSNHPLGLPTSDRKVNPVRGNEYQTFDGGVINQYGGNAYETHGAILDRWNSEGGANGWLGLPTTDEHPTATSPAARVGRYSRFQHGVINYNPYLNQTFVLAHDIGRKYASLGYAQSYLGLPTSDEFGDGGSARKQLFEGGWIRWTPAGGSVTNLEAIHGVKGQLAANSFQDDPPPASDPPPPGPGDPDPPPSPPPAPPANTYVALGDSVASGEGLEYGWEWIAGGPGSGRWIRGGTDEDSLRWFGSVRACHRSISAYPWLVRLRVGIGADGFLHQACSGATAKRGILASQREDSGETINPEPQLGTAAADHGPPSASYNARRPQVVSLTLGANDISFKDSLVTCFIQLTDCDDSKLRGDVIFDLLEQKQHLIRTFQEINQRAASLKTGLPIVLVTTYYDPFPRAYPPRPTDCRDLSLLRTSGLAQLSRNEVSFLRGALDRLNDNIRSAAAAFPNVRIVDAPADFAHHAFCSQDPWVYGPSLIAHDAKAPFNPAPFHPTHDGQAAIADAVARVLRGTRAVTAGTGVSRAFPDGLDLTFSSVADEGMVSVTGDSEPPREAAPNSTFSEPTFFEMSSSAPFSGPVEVSVSDPGGGELYRYDGERWDMLSARRDGEELVASVSDLAPLALGDPAPALVTRFTHTGGGPSPVGVDFDASSSSVADGAIARYAWSFGDGMNGEGERTSHVYESAGVYRVRLLATSEAGAVAEATGEVEVTNPAPIAGLALPPTGIAGEAMAMSGRRSSDPNGSITAWVWDFGDGGVGIGPEAQHAYGSPGTHEVTLTAIDEEGAQGVARRAVAIAAPQASLPVPRLISPPAPAGSRVPVQGGKRKKKAGARKCRKRKRGKHRRACGRQRSPRPSR